MKRIWREDHTYKLGPNECPCAYCDLCKSYYFILYINLVRERESKFLTLVHWIISSTTEWAWVGLKILQWMKPLEPVTLGGCRWFGMAKDFITYSICLWDWSPSQADFPQLSCSLSFARGTVIIIYIGSMPYIRENPVLVHGMCTYSAVAMFSRRSSGLGTFGVLHLLPRALWPWHQHAFAVSDATWPWKIAHLALVKGGELGAVGAFGPWWRWWRSWKDRSAGRRSKKYISSFLMFTSMDHFVALFCSQFPLNS